MAYFVPEWNLFPDNVICGAIIGNPDFYTCGVKIYYENEDLPKKLKDWKKGSLWSIVDSQLNEKGMFSAAFDVCEDGKGKYLCFKAMKIISE
ncbi:hypothetical protein CL616_02780 [archaeon]|nr:hypothetical protein [archaeon]